CHTLRPLEYGSRLSLAPLARPGRRRGPPVDDRSPGWASSGPPPGPSGPPPPPPRFPMPKRNPHAPTVHDATTAPGDLLNLHEIIAKARQNLNQNDWDYIVGGVETETTLRRNRMALDTIAFRPRVLRDVSRVDASVSQFGRKLRLPVVF